MPESLYPPVAFYFKVIIEGPAQSETSFQEVSGIGVEMTFESVREGGENNYSWELPKGIKHSPLVLKRGLVPADSAFLQWCSDTLNGGFAKTITTQRVQVLLLNHEGQSLSSWTFENAYPVKWSISDLGSTKNEVVVESVSLQYTSMQKDS